MANLRTWSRVRYALRGIPKRGTAALACAFIACSPRHEAQGPTPAEPPAVATDPAETRSVAGPARPPPGTVPELPGEWATVTSSPRVGHADAADAKIGNLCQGGLDASLMEVAYEVAGVLANTGELPDAQAIEWLQRRSGNPHVWPRTWGLVGQSLDRGQVARDVAKWLGPLAPRARCGLALRRGNDHRTEAYAVIAVDPVADLQPVPTRVAPGAWIDIDATLHLGAMTGRVVLLPPTGAPKTVLSNTVGRQPPHLRSKVPIDRAGRWVIQVLADDVNGPRPVLEAEVYAGVPPPHTAPSPEVPGEQAGDRVADAADALFARLNAARGAAGLPPLVRSARLDKLATAHAQEMLRHNVLGHDVGDGDPSMRVSQAHLRPKIVGENVAKAQNEKAAHRALYASPSHRGNMLESRFREVGIGAVMDAAGEQIWVAELFTG